MKGQLKQVVVGGGDNRLDLVLFDERGNALMERPRRHTRCVEGVPDEVGELPAVAGLPHPLGHLGQRQ